MVKFEQVEEELDLEYLFSRESIAYKSTRGRSGMQLNLRICPTCGDRRYRVYLNAETGAGNCFVCNQTFSKCRFIKEHFGVEWKEVGRIAEEVLREQGWRPKKKIEAAVDLGDVAIPISHELPLLEGNIAYLENRGIDGDTAKYFHLRWCEFGGFRYKDQKGSWDMQDFSNRVIIPVFDLDGSLKTFQGRDMTEGAAAKLVERKYLFPIGLPGTGRYLLNGHNFQLAEEAVMGEGFFDVAATKLAFEQDSGLRHIVPLGSFGKNLSYGDPNGDDQLGRFIILKGKGLKRLTIMWDGEEKALTAALDAAKLTSRIGIQTRIALLPYDKDPNEVLPEVVREAYYKAVVWSPAIDAKLRLRNPYSARWRVQGVKSPVI